ncbi:MAG: PQQ-binding-like beta-propeller repeat protein [Gemmataceae bacterium]
MRRFRWAMLFGVVLVASAQAVIIRLTALAELVRESSFILEAKIVSVDEKRPAMMLEVSRILKGKTDLKKMPVLIGEGDAGASKRKEAPQLLERVAVNLPLVVFVSQRDKEFTAFVFSDGTWYSLEGQSVEGNLRWRFAHLEPYLRRTFAGSTAEMLKLLEADKGYPKPDAKGKPGLGPPVKKKTGHRLPRSEANHQTMPEPEPEPRRYAVIPMVLIGGPLALLALLFPSVFAGWQRWLALLSTAGTASTLLLVHWLAFEWFQGTWLASSVAVWAALSLVHLAGFFWAMQRHAAQVNRAEAPLLPSRLEMAILGSMGILSLLGLATLALGFQQRLLTPDWWPVVVYASALVLAALYVVVLRLRGPRLQPAVSCEAVFLGLLVAVGMPLGPMLMPTRVIAGAGGTVSPTRIELAWTFQLPERGAIVSSPVLDGENIYIAAAHDSVFRPYGRLYCLDRATGQLRWKFDNAGKMRQAFSTPVIAEGMLYIGEGLHQDDQCRLYAIDAATGVKKGEYATASHTEATPVVVGERLYQGAGDDGLHCIRRSDLTKLWNFPGFHIDTGPVVVGDAVYIGSGIGDAFKETALFRLDAQTGKRVWRVATDLPVWTEVAVVGERVFVGMGNGRLNEEPQTPLGRVMCLDAKTGNELWKVKMPDGVLGRLTVDEAQLYFGCRDGKYYCLRQRDGSIRWSADLGSPIVAGAALERDGLDTPERLYVVSVAGLLACLDPLSGRSHWTHALTDGSVHTEVIATPAVKSVAGVAHLYVALTMVSSARVGELRCYQVRMQEN